MNRNSQSAQAHSPDFQPSCKQRRVYSETRYKLRQFRPGNTLLHRLRVKHK